MAKESDVTNPILKAASKTCRKCKSDKDLSEFNRYSAAPDGRQYWCRSCARSAWKIHYNANKEKENEQGRAWAKANSDKTSQYMRDRRAKEPDKYKFYKENYEKANPDKVSLWDHNKKVKRKFAINGLKIKQKDWTKLKRLSNYKCVYCGSDEKLTLDHEVPLSNGGPHIINNIIPSCKTCNCMKTNLSVKDFLERNSERTRYYQSNSESFLKARSEAFPQ